MECYHVLGIFFLCILTSGCTKKAIDHSGALVINQQEARLVDIPMPLYDKRLSVVSNDSNTEDNTILGYRSSLSADVIIDFYVHEMERLGWQQLKLFQGTESLVQFESPERFCSISIRSSNMKLKHVAGTDFFVFVGRKQV